MKKNMKRSAVKPLRFAALAVQTEIGGGFLPRISGALRIVPLALCAALVTGSLLPLSTLARTVTVASCDRTTGETTISISAAEVGDGDKALFAAWSSSNIADIADASETAYVGVVAEADTEKSYTIPSEWLGRVGVVSFFLMADVPPYDALLTYIRSASAGPYIDTGFVPDTNSDVRVKTYYPANTGVVPFGVKGMLNFFSVWYDTPDPTTGAYYVRFFGALGPGTSGSGATVPRSSGPHEYTINATGAYIDGNLYQSFNSADFTESTTNSMTLFARKVDGETVGSQGDCTIYWAQLRQNGVLVHDYVPCSKNGVATMYDRVNQSFCAVSGSGSFTEGEALDPDAQDCGVIESSDVVVVIPGPTWDGGGADTSFTTAANWEGDELPNLSDGLTTLTFATGGSEAQVPASGASASGITFDTANNFALKAASGGMLSLGAGGITLANRAVPSDTTWRYHDLNLPVMLVADQTWDLSTVSKQRLRLLADGNLQGSAARTLTVTGSGCLSISSTNDFAGNVVLSNGGRIVILSQLRPFGSAADGGEIVIDQSKGAVLDMFSAVIDKPIRITSTSSGNEDKFGAYGTSAITAPIYQASANPLVVDMEYHPGYGLSTLTLSGGGTFSGPVWVYPDNTELRTLVIEGAPIVHSAPGDTDKAFKFYGKGELHLKNQGNRMGIALGANQHCWGNSLHCWTNNVLSTDCDVSLSYSGRMDIHGFDQQFGDLTTGSGGRIRSDEPAEIYAYYDIDGGKTWGVNAGLDGAVTFRKGGRQPLTINGTNTTTGALIAQNGPLVIGETGFWQSTDVRIGATNSNRHASLQLKRSNSFADPMHTILTMTASTRTSGFNTDCGESREPELNLDEGVNAVFKKVILNGRCLASGTWGGSGSSAEHKDATHFSGSGMITVLTGGGFFLIVR